MIISLITAWIATICAVLTALKYIAKKNVKTNRLFHKIHIPLGVVLILSGVIHGLLAGNPYGIRLSEASYGQILLTANMGTLCLILSILLGITYLSRKLLKRKWMVFHRVLTVLLLVSVIIHVFQMGITLPNRILGISGVEAAMSEIQNDIESTEEESLVEFSGAVLKDGTYEGSAEGFRSVIKVSVTVLDGMVSDITIIEEQDTPQFMERAKGIIDSILNDQSLEVDGISGATYSSKGIQNAVYNALQNAVEQGELVIKEIQINDTRGHGGKKHS